MIEKRNVVEGKRTPEHELERLDSNWDKESAAEFDVNPAVQIADSMMAAMGYKRVEKRDDPSLRSTVVKRD